jgi:DNA (cytosine-5)-methyltransferase 1
MKSDNPHSGIYKADTTRTLDLNGGNPACNQGGMIVLEGNGSRESHKGDGYKESDVMYTLNTVEQHAVCMGTAYDGSQVSPTITANNAAGQQRMPDKDNFNAVIAYGVDCYNQTQAEEVTQPLRSINADTDHIPCVYGIDRASFNQGKNAQYDFAVDEDLAQTLVSRGPGGGTEQTVGALCARDYKGVGSQYVNEGKCIIQRFE